MFRDSKLRQQEPPGRSITAYRCLSHPCCPTPSTASVTPRPKGLGAPVGVHVPLAILGTSRPACAELTNMPNMNSDLDFGCSGGVASVAASEASRAADPFFKSSNLARSTAAQATPSTHCHRSKICPDSFLAALSAAEVRCFILWPERASSQMGLLRFGLTCDIPPSSKPLPC